MGKPAPDAVAMSIVSIASYTFSSHVQGQFMGVASERQGELV